MYIVPVHVFLSVCICSAIRSGFEFSTGDTGDDDLAPNCAEGKQDPQDHNVFILDPQDARDLNLLQPWCLREDNACQGPKVCQVAVTPRIDPWEPINGSELLITILANCTTSGQLFLCPERSSRPGCAASLQLPGLPTRPRHLFRFIISKPRMQVLDHRRFVFDEVLEAVLVVELVSTACALVWLVSEMLFMHSVNHLGDVCEEYDKRLQMPGAFEVMCEGLLDATCFVFGCILYLGACSQFLHKYGSQSQNVDTLILCIPAIFGPCSLLRIFLSISRRQLYYTLYRRGILLVFEKVPMWKDLLLIWSMMGSVLAVVAVLSGLGLAVSMNQVSKRDMLTQLLVFTSPLYTMVSSFQWEMDAETHCAQRRCVLELDEQSPGEEQAVTTSHKLRVVSERSFCAAARSAHSITECLERKMDLCESSGPAFGPRDMMWANHFLCQTSSKHRLSLVVFMPLLLLCILSLAMGSTVLAIKHRIVAEVSLFRDACMQQQHAAHVAQQEHLAAAAEAARAVASLRAPEGPKKRKRGKSAPSPLRR
ncbi:unnamed protein product [Effrenium voratum]|nr:unnamed protein product [Effrenium voratum]